MSGFEIRELPVNTLQVHNEPQILKPGGLKDLFEKRNMSHTSVFNLDSSISIPNQQSTSQYNETELSNIYSQDDINTYPLGYHSIHRLDTLSNQQGNLKRTFEARMGGLTRRTLGRNNKQKLSLEKHANIIVSKMEQDESLMEDSPTAEELRKVALRDMPQCLTIKRCVKDKLSKSINQKSKKKTLSCYKMFKYQASMAISKFKMGAIDLAYSFELWYDALKKIEGNFGTGVASFFRFLRWLFLVNVVISSVSFLFIVLPCIIDGNIINQTSSNSTMWDWLTGEGYFVNTVMYYGNYPNKTISTIGSLTYSMPNAYFFTMALIYIFSIVYFGWSAAKSYRRSFIETEGGLKNVFANKIFCGWDYNIATKPAAELKSKAIFNELRELINDFAYKKRNLTFFEKARIRIIQFFSNILVMFIMIIVGYAIWQFLSKVSMERETLIVVLPLGINIIMMFMPMIFSFMVKFEDYKNPKVSMLLTLIRTSVLGIVTIGVLSSYWIPKTNDTDNKTQECWENSLGQEIYRMIIFDFFISVLFGAIFDVILYGIYKLKGTYYLEFDIAWNTMHIIYNQSLFWVGLVFVPILPIIIVIKLFLIWYIRQCVVLYLCQPSSKTWRAASTSTWFLSITFVTLLLVGFLLAYIISYVQVSNSCGPFKEYDYLIDVVTQGLLKLKSNSSVWSVVLWFTKPGFITVIIISMCSGVYILNAKANAQKETVTQYRNMLLWSAKDKEYYYNLISKFTSDQTLSDFNDKDINPELHQPEQNSYYEGGDIRRGASSSSFTFQPSTSVSTIEPTTSSMSFDWNENGRGQNPKKIL